MTLFQCSYHYNDIEITS